MTALDLVNHIPVLPEVLLLVGACAVMIVDARSADARRSAGFVLAQVVLLACALCTLWVLKVQVEAGGSKLFLFGGLFVSDVMSGFLKLVTYVATWAALVYSRQYLLDRSLLRGEFLSLLLFSLLGMMILVSAGSFLTVYLGLELMSLCLYALVALNRDSAASTEAAMKYFVLGALSSGLLLYGMSMVYGATGSLELQEVSRQVKSLLSSGADRVPMRPFLVFGLVFVVAGIAFKVGVAPFHMWIPDVYHGAPTPVTLIIGSGPKLAALAMAIRLLVDGMLDLAQDWQQMLGLMALLSMAIGNITAIAQTNLKRMLAYSTIAHMGFMLLGLMSGVVGGNRLSAPDAYSAALFYGVVYVVMALAAFGMILLLARPGFEADTLDDMRGLSKRSPWYAFVMMVVMFSLAGIPPTVGFYAKLAVFQVAVAAGYLWLAVAAVLLSLVGAFYYLRIVKLMYFDEMRDSPGASQPARHGKGMEWLLSANGMALLVLGVLPQGLMALCFAAIQSLKIPG
ncbi:MAG TPA: NADH-quinone oxidoreductase subunit NuoN [Burkholderiales bacterium]|nr:NADH-quinone oxidoreductase subunit NuoN [Burkholderiales bacterium]